MSRETATIESPRELDYRESHGVHVWLLWLPSEDRVVVRVLDVRRDVILELPTDGARALDVFRHPFAYAPPLEYGTDELDDDRAITGRHATQS